MPSLGTTFPSHLSRMIIQPPCSRGSRRDQSDLTLRQSRFPWPAERLQGRGYPCPRTPPIAAQNQDPNCEGQQSTSYCRRKVPLPFRKAPPARVSHRFSSQNASSISRSVKRSLAVNSARDFSDHIGALSQPTRSPFRPGAVSRRISRPCGPPPPGLKLNTDPSMELLHLETQIAFVVPSRRLRSQPNPSLA